MTTQNPFKLVNVHGSFEWRGVNCPRCNTPIALWREQFKGGSHTTMKVRHFETNTARCPKEIRTRTDG